MELKLTAHYLTDGKLGCKTAPTFIAGAVEGAYFPSSVSVPLVLQRHGDQYVTTFQVDEFVPGYCDWRFGYIDALVLKDGKTSISNVIVRARDGWNTPHVNTATENSLDQPVNLHCDFRGIPRDTPGYRANACSGKSAMRKEHKREHFLTDATTQIIANFIDDEASTEVPH